MVRIVPCPTQRYAFQKPDTSWDCPGMPAALPPRVEHVLQINTPHMARDRLRSNVQVRTAGVDPSLALMIFGLVVSALLLLTMLGTKADARRTRRPLNDERPAPARADF